MAASTLVHVVVSGLPADPRIRAAYLGLAEPTAP
jgi:hypothetical protein